MITYTNAKARSHFLPRIKRNIYYCNKESMITYIFHKICIFFFLSLELN